MKFVKLPRAEQAQLLHGLRCVGGMEIGLYSYLGAAAGIWGFWALGLVVVWPLERGFPLSDSTQSRRLWPEAGSPE